MIASEDLHTLIASLSMQEKRHFKIHALSGYVRKGGNNYVKLFDAIEAQTQYDEEKIKQKFKGETFIKHLPSEKNQLQGLVLKSLRQYHSQFNIDVTLKEMLIDAEVLQDRSLYVHCRKVLAKAKKLAYKYERFVFIPEIIRIESRMYDLEVIDKLAEEERTALKKMETISRLRVLSNRTARLVASAHQLRKESEMKEFEKIISDPRLVSEENADSFTAKVFFFYIKGVYHEMQGELDRSHEYRARFVQIMEENPLWMEIHVKNYLPALNNLAISQMELGHYDEMAETIQKIRGVGERPKVTEDIRMQVFIFSSILEMNYCLRTGEVQNGVYAAKTAEAGLKKFGNSIHPQYMIVLHNSMKYIYFKAGDLKRALQWSNKVLHETSADIRQDIQGVARIFNLILHYELGNTDQLEYYIRSTYRFLLKRNRLYKVESIVLDYLRRNTGLISRKEILVSFRKLHEELQPLTQDPWEKRAFEEFDLIRWLEGKIEIV